MPERCNKGYNMSSSRNKDVIFPLALILTFAFISSSQAQKITLDRDFDRSREFVDIDCYYSEDYEDFWVWGCGAEPSAERPTDSIGYWSACSKECQIIYNTGILEKPKTIIVEGYITGSSEIRISGARSLANISEWEPISTISSSEDWISVSISLTDFPDLYIFIINPIPGAEGFILIDKVILDLGDDDTTSGPTSFPATSTPPPEETGIIPLDKENDHPKYWQHVMCHYAGHYDDFDQAWGCPTNLEGHVSDVEPNIGYWTSCQRDYCEMLYYGSIISPPLSVRLHTFIRGSAEIHIIGKRSPYDDLDYDRHMYTISVGKENSLGYCNKIQELDIAEFPDIYAVSVKLVSAHDGFALVDRLSTQLKPGVDDGYQSSIAGDVLCNVFIEPEPTTGPTTTTSTGTTSTTTEPTTTTKPTTTTEPTTTTTTAAPPTDAGIYTRSDANLLLFVLTCLCVKYFI